MLFTIGALIPGEATVSIGRVDGDGQGVNNFTTARYVHRGGEDGIEIRRTSQRVRAIDRGVQRGRHQLRPRLLELAAEPRFRERVVHLRSPQALHRWQAMVTHDSSQTDAG